MKPRLADAEPLPAEPADGVPNGTLSPGSELSLKRTNWHSTQAVDSARMRRPRIEEV